MAKRVYLPPTTRVHLNPECGQMKSDGIGLITTEDVEGFETCDYCLKWQARQPEPDTWFDKVDDVLWFWFRRFFGVL